MPNSTNKTHADPLAIIGAAVILLWPILRWLLAGAVVVHFMIGHWFTAFLLFALLCYLSWWVACGKLPKL